MGDRICTGCGATGPTKPFSCSDVSMRLCASCAPRLGDASPGLTEAQLITACLNVGVDITCGACAMLFYTGFTGPTSRHDALPSEHDASCLTVRRSEAVGLKVECRHERRGNAPGIGEYCLDCDNADDLCKPGTRIADALLHKRVSLQRQELARLNRVLEGERASYARERATWAKGDRLPKLEALAEQLVEIAGQFVALAGKDT